MSKLYTKLSKQFPSVTFKKDHSLNNQTYFKVGGNAEVYLEENKHDQINAIHQFCSKEKIKLTILGGASNVIVSDQGVEGLVLKITDQSFSLESETKEEIFVQSGAGLQTALLVKNTVDNNLTGLEKFLGVPGTVGGAVYNNAHYLEELIGAHVSKVKVSTSNKGLVWLVHDQLDFDYDYSRFHKTNEIILTIEFKLKKSDKKLSQKIMKESSLYRANTQPLGVPSSGCIFQNTPNTPELKEKFPQFADRQYISGGFLIDQAGLKGTKVGDIEVSQKHAAFFVNNGQGTAKDVMKLIDLVKNKVNKKFGINLKEEVFYLR